MEELEVIALAEALGIGVRIQVRFHHYPVQKTSGHDRRYGQDWPFSSSGTHIQSQVTEEVRYGAAFGLDTWILKIMMCWQHMDASGGGLNHHDVPEGCEPVVHMLYRPGHYDLIYLA